MVSCSVELWRFPLTNQRKSLQKKIWNFNHIKHLKTRFFLKRQYFWRKISTETTKKIFFERKNSTKNVLFQKNIFLLFIRFLFKKNLCPDRENHKTFSSVCNQNKNKTVQRLHLLSKERLRRWMTGIKEKHHRVVPISFCFYFPP